MIIWIDNGHGKETKGKCSPDAAKKMFGSPYYFKEYSWCREVAQMVCDMLQADGYDARLLVPELRDVPLAERCRRANATGKKDSILVSIHNNAAGNGSRWMKARGWAVYTTKGITEADRLAECVYRRAEKAFRRPLTVRAYSRSRKYGHDFEENYYILLHTYCPAILIENFFQDNKEDVAYLKSAGGKADCAGVVVDGIKDYLKGAGA